MFGSIGLGEMLVILVVALVVIGPQKLPELARSIGRGLAEFRKATHEIRNSLNLSDLDQDHAQGWAGRQRPSAPRPRGPSLVPPAETATTADKGVTPPVTPPPETIARNVSFAAGAAAAGAGATELTSSRANQSAQTSSAPESSQADQAVSAPSELLSSRGGNVPSTSPGTGATSDEVTSPDAVKGTPS